MAVLAADRNTQSKEATLKSYPVAVDIIYKGGMVVINSAGYAAPASDAQGNSRAVGVADEKVDNSGGSAGDKNVRVRSGRAFKMVATAIVQADLGMAMYVVDDQTIDDDGGTNRILAGILVEFVSATSGWVYIPTPGENAGKGFINLNILAAREISSNDIPAISDGPLTSDPNGFGGLMATNTTPALERVNGATDKAIRVRWAAANVVEVQLEPVAIPPDLDETHDISIHFYAEMAGATDTPVLTVAFFANKGDSNAGGNSAALSATEGEVFVDIAAADIPTHPGFFNISVLPGAHGADAADLYAAWIEYSKRP